MAGAGYTYSSTFLNTAFFKRLIIPCNQRVLSSNSLVALNRSTSTPQEINDPITPSVLFGVIDFDTGLIGSFSSVAGVYTYNGSLTNATININLTATGTYNDITYTFYKNGVAVDIKSNSSTYELTTSITLNTNDTIQMIVTGSGNGSSVYINGNIKVTTVSLLPVPINLGDAIVINDTIPKGIFQKDFFTSVLKMFNLMVTEDKFTDKHLNIEPYIDFYTGTVLDWSDKLDRSKPIKIKPMSEATARYYELKWKQDNDFYNEDYRKKYNEGYGDRIFDNGLEFAKDSEKVDVIFAASTLYGKDGEDKVFPAIYKKSDNNTKEDPIEHIVRIMQVKKITGVASWNILNGATNLGSNTTYLYGGHFDDPDAPNADLNFGATKELYFELAAGNLSNNLFNTYYSPYLAEITDKDSRLLSGNFKLTQLDIFNLDFAKFIYIDGGLYRLSKVIDYTAETNEVTKVELLRVINKTY